ncbi:MAG: MarR family winged helix-turn-helix transcriptional regulator [Bdellovibrionota bacterium]
MKADKSIYCSCLFFSANALARRMTELADSAFLKLGFPAAHAFVLMTVNRQPGITIGEIAKIHLLASSTVTRLVEKLENQGWLRREPDRRIVRVFPQAKSLSRQKELEKLWASIFDHYSSVLGRSHGNALTQDISNAYYELIERTDS